MLFDVYNTGILVSLINKGPSSASNMVLTMHRPHNLPNMQFSGLDCTYIADNRLQKWTKAEFFSIKI